MRRGRWLLILAMGWTALSPARSFAQEPAEEILSYDVRIEVSDGGVMQVTEAIEVRALGDEIRRGIYRDFPTRFPREGGGAKVVAPFQVLSVTRDGHPKPYALEQILGPAGRGGIRVRIGDADVFLPQGVFRYEIVYETERWLQFGDTEDQLYWNVTGNGWTFPILSASVTVTLPRQPDPSAVRLEAWTGPEGSVAQDVAWRWEGRGAAVFTTTETLGEYEGLTVRVSVPSGVILPPSAEQEAAWFRMDWGGYVEAAPIVILLLGIYLFMWVRVGRDPASGRLVVRYEPPEGFSPAALGFLAEREYEPAQLNAALVNLAVKGAVTIEKDGRKWRVH